MATTYNAAIQQLYVAYFNRPADVAGLQYWETVVENAKGSTAAVSAAFAASAEYKAAYANMDAYHVVNTVYQNLFGHDADLPGLNFWAQNLMAGKFTVDQAVTAIAAGAQGTDKDTYTNRVAAATAFTNLAASTSQGTLDYTGNAANAQAKAWLNGVTDSTSLANAIDPAALANSVNNVVNAYLESIGQTVSLTSGVDNLTGTAGNDHFIVTTSATTGNPLNAFDSIDGGAGTDSINFVDTQTATAGQFMPVNPGVTVKNVELINVTTTGGVNLDTSGIAGVTADTVNAAGIGAVQVKAADSTNVTVNSATQSTTTVAGGKAVAVSLSDAGAGAVSVTGAGLTSVSITGGNTVTVDNVDSKAASAKGTTLTGVTLSGIAGGATLNGASLTSVSLNNLTSAQTVTVNNGTASHTLTVNANAVGYNGSTANVVTVADANATTVALNVNSKSDLALSAAKATKVTVAGAGATVLDLTGAQAKLATVDASATTGGVTLSGLGTGVTSVTTGSGNDSVVLYTVTAAATTTAAAVNATVSTGAGNDTIDLSNVNLAAGGNFVVSAGDGNDTIKVSQGQLGAGNTIDGGTGTDTIVLNNNTAAFAAGDYAVINSTISNVEGIEFKNAVGGIDASKVAFTAFTFDNTATITGVTSQTLTSTGASLTATASGDTAAVVGTSAGTYAGSLNVTTTNAASTLTLNADSATVNVKSTTSVAASTTIQGDLQTSLTVNLTNSANASSSPTGDNTSSATILVNAAQNTALKSVVLTGAGSVTIDASASGALSNIDASKLGGTIANGANKGFVTGGLTFTGNANIAETISLGSGHDTITVNSTYAKMDTIVGFDATQEGSTGASTADVLIIKGSELNSAAPTADLTINGLTALTTGQTTEAGLAKLTLGTADSTLDLAFVHAASVAGNNVVEFQFGGNTYLFADSNHNGTLDNTDFAVKLVGTVDVTGAFGLPPATA